MSADRNLIVDTTLADGGIRARNATRRFMDTFADTLWFVRAYVAILQVHWLLNHGGWNRVRVSLERERLPRRNRPADPRLIARIERAVISACEWQWRPTACLPRAIVAYRLLRRAGTTPCLNIGFRVPIMGHAWVELDGRTIADDMTPSELREFQITAQIGALQAPAIRS